MSIRTVAKIAEGGGAAAESAGDIMGNTFKVGEMVLVRTAVYDCIGRFIGVSRCCDTYFAHFEEACYLAVGGVFNKMLTKGELDEAEPIPGEFRVNIASIGDISQWAHGPVKKPI